MRDVKGDHFTLGTEAVTDLGKVDVVLMRQDPPFDMAYITATHILERLQPKTLVVNDPFHVRNAPEKLFVTLFKDLMPPTLITSDRAEIASFRAEHKDIILKPLYGNGGAGVFRVKPDDENISSLLEMFTTFYREPVIVQRYVPEVRQGDKRIILVDGEYAGALNRVPAAGEARSNLHVGGKAEATDADGARTGDLRAPRPGAEKARPDLYRHRRNRTPISPRSTSPRRPAFRRSSASAAPISRR